MLNPEGLFLSFLERIAKGQCTREDWKSFAVTHYGVPAAETARRALVRAAIELDFNPNGAVPPTLVTLAKELCGTLAGEVTVVPH
jgi:hypothetical protein